MATLTINLDSADEYSNAVYALQTIRDRANSLGVTLETLGPNHRMPTTLILSGESKEIGEVFAYLYRDADAVISAASNIEFRKYRAMIERAAQGIRDEIANGDYADADALTESIESAGEVVYYAEAALTLRHSQNDDAYLEAYNEDEAVDDCVKASFAQVADIREELGDLEELYDKLAPLSDDEKAEAVEYVNSELASRPDATYTRGDVVDLFLDAAGTIRASSDGQSKVMEYLGETVTIPTTD